MKKGQLSEVSVQVNSESFLWTTYGCGGCGSGTTSRGSGGFSSCRSCSGATSRGGSVVVVVVVVIPPPGVVVVLAVVGVVVVLPPEAVPVPVTWLNKNLIVMKEGQMIEITVQVNSESFPCNT